jgi:hypothetical protein
MAQDFFDNLVLFDKGHNLHLTAAFVTLFYCVRNTGAKAHRT